MQRIRQATETIAGLTHRVAALRDIVTVDYPAGNRTTVPMVNSGVHGEGSSAEAAGADPTQAAPGETNGAG